MFFLIHIVVYQCFIKEWITISNFAGSCALFFSSVMVDIYILV